MYTRLCVQDLRGLRVVPLHTALIPATRKLPLRPTGCRFHGLEVPRALPLTGRLALALGARDVAGGRSRPSLRRPAPGMGGLAGNPGRGSASPLRAALRDAGSARCRGCQAGGSGSDARKAKAGFLRVPTIAQTTQNAQMRDVHSIQYYG